MLWHSRFLGAVPDMLMPCPTAGLKSSSGSGITAALVDGVSGVRVAQALLIN